MAVSLSLLSLNIERSIQLERVLPFLKREQPEVACIQELYERDIPALEAALGSPCFFVPMTRQVSETPPECMGTGIFSKLPVVSTEAHCYSGDSSRIPEMDPKNPALFNNKNFFLALARIQKEGSVFTIGTTHFRWTPDGSSTPEQVTDMNALLALLGETGEFVLTGDFNAPRGGEVYAMLAERYTDNVPPEYATSIDPNLHRAGPLQLMVDGIFSTPSYTVSDFRMVPGVSDHQALLATVSTG